MSTVNQTHFNPARVSLLLIAADSLNYLPTAIIISQAALLNERIHTFRVPRTKAKGRFKTHPQPPTPPPSDCHKNAARPAQPGSGCETEPRGSRTDRGTRGLQGAPRRPPSLAPDPGRRYTTLGQGQPPPACPRAASSARVWVFLKAQRRDAASLLQGRGRSAPCALPPRLLPAQR